MQIIEAVTFKERLIGLLGRNSLPDNTGLKIHSCRQVHTFFMKFTIDVIFLDKNNKIIHMETLKPFRFSKYVWRAKSCVEFNEGTIKEKQLEINDIFLL